MAILEKSGAHYEELVAAGTAEEEHEEEEELEELGKEQGEA